MMDTGKVFYQWAFAIFPNPTVYVLFLSFFLNRSGIQYVSRGVRLRVQCPAPMWNKLLLSCCTSYWSCGL